MRKTFSKWQGFVLGAMFVLVLGIATGGDRVCAAAAPDWPKQDITIIVPYNPGGGFDLVARATAPYIKKHLPKSVNVVVKNVPGAGAKVGLREMVKSTPDGYTVAVLDPAEIGILDVGEQLKGLDIRNIVWLGRLDKLPDMLVVASKAGFKNPGDMKGKKVRFASVGSGVLFRSSVLSKAIGAEPHFVNYEGAGEAALAAMRGDLDAIVLNWSSLMRNVRASEGKLSPMFVSSPVPGLNVPTGRELGLVFDESVLGYSHVIGAPPGLAPELRRMWEEALTKVYNDPEWAAQMNKAGYPPAPLSGSKLDEMVASIFGGLERFKDVINQIFSGT